MQRRWKQWSGAFVAALVVTAACSDDDDAGDTEPTIDSVVPDTTAPPPETTAAPTTTTTTSTTVPPSTTMSADDLKAQIAADYQRSWQLRNDVVANPTLDGLDDKVAQISAPASENYNRLRDFITELVTLGERVVPGSPDEFRIDIEGVDLVGQPPHQEAVVTICLVDNAVRVDASGEIVRDYGIVASRSGDHVVRTPNGWLPDGSLQDTWQGLGVTQCPA